MIRSLYADSATQRVFLHQILKFHLMMLSQNDDNEKSNDDNRTSTRAAANSLKVKIAHENFNSHVCTCVHDRTLTHAHV